MWICRGKCENEDTSGAHVCRCIRHMEDLESGQENQTENKQNEVSIYEKHDRRPTGYCHVETIHEEDLTSLPSLTTQKETIEKEGLTSCPPLLPPMPKILVFEKEEKHVSAKMTTKKVTFKSDVDCDMETSQRRASEKVKVIRKLSSSIGRPSLLDEIEIAKEVIMDRRASNDKARS
ncbi:uncharacterized protein LOC116303369 [Actinia tenebrosa]|uniref:Uncharacterized protein LOC116303369 n=1 Tax=Actinia tenebrosa TaxID=6105 RepID=A0A6P8IPG9_ACTTE|nr:uncharacterized protein LOC116303369 [Actinia tenebrosa]